MKLESKINVLAERHLEGIKSNTEDKRICETLVWRCVLSFLAFGREKLY